MLFFFLKFCRNCAIIHKAKEQKHTDLYGFALIYNLIGGNIQC